MNSLQKMNKRTGGIAGKNLAIQRWVVLVSVLLLGIKFFAWFITHSVAIFTDALESIVNVVAAMIGLYSLTVAARPRDRDHPYGHGKVEFLSAAVEGTMIGLAGLFILYKAISNLFLPAPLHRLDEGMGLVAATAIINFAMGWICVRTGTRNQSPALVASGRHLLSDTWTTAGIITGLVLLYFTGLAWIDSVVAMLFALFILFTAYRIIRGSVAGIMDEADSQLLSRLVDLLNDNRRENWVDLHNLRVIKYGHVLHVDCHLTVPWYLNVHEAHAEVDRLSALIRYEMGESIELFVHADGCQPFSCRICSKPGCPERKHPFEQRIAWTPDNILQNKKHELV